ncbi:LytTR family transcriptional regulator DNA-binding domain-containing protein [Galbibacter sp. EGI 63066]|uniref:LytTR family transcriptional regulator DNA-binding domain-containing protein n=1 Tax=Galbibacter sp. EGI 63066 TaxID=2993559 RepID=UPI002248C8E5|nr:LytTR family transcriptional regulator DNA-binding domain-containing protein [Galbibacter sp. EGI 63066]MCX2678684.1 LytTR family transcriptional regulator DNA-binding domain-containing protein [Galbibacter sp. EGI 63066]
MKKDHVYLLTFLGLAVVTSVVSYFSMNHLLEISTNHFLQTQIESSKREANEISLLIQHQVENGLPKHTIIKNLQSSIENTNTESGFVCMFNWSGVEICHPNPEKIGQQVLPEESFVQPVMYNELNPQDFYNLLKNKAETGGIREFSEEGRSSEIIYLYPVKGTDWIMAAHANINHIKDRMQKLKTNFIITFTMSGILLIIISLFMVRLISGRYEKNLEKQNEGLSKEVVTLSKLNNDLLLYKEKKERPDDTHEEKKENSLVKKRILTYVKDEIVSIEQENIAFVYTENSITYICCLDGKIFHSNNSLEEIFSDLDSTLFFRANRQFIISVNAIDKIYKYGNNQLKIELNPRSPINIIISKNRASAFKHWLRG